MKQKVLIIEDSKTVHTLLKGVLKDEPIDLHSAYNGDAGLALATTLQPDLVLLDVEMPQPNGFEVCRQLKANPGTMGIAVIFVTGAASTDEKIAGLELGAVDYITKPFDPAEVRARVRASLRTKYLQDLLAKRAMIDGLTGLWNRAYLDHRIGTELSQSKRSGRPLSCIMADVDHFKAINDKYGHPCGDEALRSIGQLFMDECRAEDIICRYGGEEFAILTPGINLEGATALAERLRKALIGNPVHRGSTTIPITCSFGIAEVTTTEASAAISAADQALYQAKAAGRNCVVAVRSEEYHQFLKA